MGWKAREQTSHPERAARASVLMVTDPGCDVVFYKHEAGILSSILRIFISYSYHRRIIRWILSERKRRRLRFKPKGLNKISDRIYYSKEAEERALRERTVIALVVLGLGLGFGAALALLFAPRSGEEIRHEIARQANYTAESSRDSTSKAVEMLQRDLKHLREDIEERLKKIQR
jgi:DNA polymerase III delta prime subunit